MVSVTVRKEKGSYEHVSSSEWLPTREKCLNRMRTVYLI